MKPLTQKVCVFDIPGESFPCQICHSVTNRKQWSWPTKYNMGPKKQLCYHENDTTQGLRGRCRGGQVSSSEQGPQVPQGPGTPKYTLTCWAKGWKSTGKHAQRGGREHNRVHTPTYQTFTCRQKTLFTSVYALICPKYMGLGKVIHSIFSSIPRPRRNLFPALNTQFSRPKIGKTMTNVNNTQIWQQTSCHPDMMFALPTPPSKLQLCGGLSPLCVGRVSQALLWDSKQQGVHFPHCV